MNQDFEFKQLLRAYRAGVINQATFEMEMTDLERRASTNGHVNGSGAGGFKAFGRTYKSERDAIVSFLDKVRAAESFAGEILPRWLAVCKTDCLRGGLAMVAEREAYHGRVFERRLQALGGEKRAGREITEEQRKYCDFVSNPSVSDGDKLLRATGSIGDPQKAIQPICDFVELIKDDQETKEMLKLFAADELSSGTFLRDACALLNAPKDKPAQASM